MNLRQIHDITYDRLATQLVTEEKPRARAAQKPHSKQLSITLASGLTVD
jgi:hypothetical protein